MDSIMNESQLAARLRPSEPTSWASSEAGQFPISNVRYRIAAPPLPPLPMTQDQSGEQYREIVEALGLETLVDEPECICVAEGIELADESPVRFLNRMPSMPWDHNAATKFCKGRPTICVVVKFWPVGCQRLYEQAVIKVKQALDAKMLARGFCFHIGVEMISEDLRREKYMFPITTELATQGMAVDWPKIQDMATNILERHPNIHGHIRSIALFRLGFSRLPESNLNTVYISVDYECSELTWQPALEWIEQYVRKFEYAHLRVHIEHQVLEQCQFKTIPGLLRNADGPFRNADGPLRNADDDIGEADGPLRDATYFYPTKANLGAEIGAANYIKTLDADGKICSPSTGTLGCWLELETGSEWKRVILTSYDAIRPACPGFKIRVDYDDGSGCGKSRALPRTETPDGDSETYEMDQFGGTVRPDSRLLVECPPRSRYNMDISHNEAMIQLGSRDIKTKSRRDLEGIVDFLEDGQHILGSVYLTSGYLRHTDGFSNRRQNWALIFPLNGTNGTMEDTTARVGNNMLPHIESPDFMFSGRSPPEDLVCWSTLGWPSPWATDPRYDGFMLSLNDNVYKVGAATGNTTGLLNTMKTRIFDPQEMYGDGTPRPNQWCDEDYTFFQGGSSSFSEGGTSGTQAGDSGSVVWDKFGRALGLLSTRGQISPQQTRGTIAFITPMDDVYQDINNMSGGSISDISVAHDAAAGDEFLML